MELVKMIIDSKGKQIIGLVPFGDMHVGNNNCDKAKILEIRDFILKTGCHWIGMGDYMDAIVYTDEKRYDPETVDPDFLLKYASNGESSERWVRTCIDKQFNWIKKMMYPIKHLCLGLHVGNHEDELRRRTGHDYVIQLCDELGVEYLGDTAYVRLVIRNARDKANDNPAKYGFTIFSHHGHYNGEKMGGAVNKLVDISSGWEADIYLMGHTHWVHGWRHISKQLNVLNGDYRHPLRLDEHKKVYALTGGFLRAYVQGSSSYLEKRGKSERKVGVVQINIEYRRRDIHVTE